MKQSKKVFVTLSLFTAVILLIAGGCTKDNVTTPAQTTSYNLMFEDVLGVSGTVTFTESSSTSAIIDIVLSNAPAGNHPAYLYMNSAVENGAVLILLNPVNETGKSSTTVTTMNYAELVAYDGCVKVLNSIAEPDVILAQGDIGGNVITDTHKSYALNLVGSYGVAGTALFEKRVNGNTLVTVALTGTISGQFYPATINLGSTTSVGGGPVVKALKNVNGTTGKSYTNIQQLDGGTIITYENWLVYDGYLNVYQTSVNVQNIICQGNIGAN